MSLKNQSGAGLIEALIAILILSIGLLGMLGMQTAALKYEQSSWIRSALSISLASMADRVRANVSSIETAYSTTSTYAAARSAIDADPAYFTPAINCDVTACTTAELATYDMLIWRRDLDANLPGGTGFVVPTGTKGIDLRFLVTVAWYDKDNVNAGVIQSPAICTAGTTGVASRNCCPSALGTAAALAGVRCANLELIP
jgi:type IV pilus assembly protein PilV